MTQLETVKEIRTELAPLKQHVSEVDGKASQALTETKELTMPDLVKSAVFCRDSVCLGTKRDYFMVHTATGEVKELFPVSQAKDGNPVAVVLPSESGAWAVPKSRPSITVAK